MGLGSNSSCCWVVGGVVVVVVVVAHGRKTFGGLKKNRCKTFCKAHVLSTQKEHLITSCG